MRVLLAALSLLATPPVLAAATDWQELAPGARARLISSDLETGGKVRIGLEIDMGADLKTYWRIPGETGIPTTFDFSGSQGVAGHQVLWPHPTIESTPDYTDFVYRGPTVIPIELTSTGSPLVVDLDLVLGICSDICVPAQASFVLPLSLAKPDTGQSLRIDQAIANTPIAAPDDTGIGAVSLDGEALAVVVHSQDVDSTSVIAATADPAVLFGAPQKSPDNGIVILPLLGGSGQTLVGQQIEITYMTPAGPYRVERKIAAAGSTPVAR